MFYRMILDGVSEIVLTPPLPASYFVLQEQ